MTEFRTGVLVLGFILAIPSSRVASSPGFIRNEGQWPAEVSFLLSQGDADFWFTHEGVTVSLYLFADPEPLDGFEHRLETDREASLPVGQSVLRIRFLDAAPELSIEGEDRQLTYHNYFLGNNPALWRSHVPLFSRVRYREVYPGVDVLYHPEGNGLKYDLLVAPGADPSQIVLQYEGVTSLDVTPDGNLFVGVGETTLLEGRPDAWQFRNGRRIPVDVSFHIQGNDTVTFEITDYDRMLPLVIDPPVELLYSSYLGGSERENGNALALDADDCRIIAGETRSSDFPVEEPFQEVYGGSRDAFVSKVSQDGGQLLFSTFLGGSFVDYARDIVLSEYEEIVITGNTGSSDFPLLNPFQGYQNGQDGFITKLSPDGATLLSSTYLGGSMDESSQAITIDPSGSMTVVGYTDSPDFPLQDPFQATYTSPLDDAFITCISPEGDSLVYSTYMGGYGTDQAYDVIVDGEGYCYVTGRTSSSNFPVMNAYQESFAGTMDAFAVKLCPDGSEMIYGTYLGGSLWDDGRAVGLHEGCLLIAGSTESLDFPVKYAFQEELAGGPSGDGFLTKLDPTGQELDYSTFYGGALSDGLRGLWVDEGGSAFVTGYTLSPDLPLQNPFQGNLAGSNDCMVARFTPWGTELFWSTFLGGTESDAGLDIEVDASGNTHIVGTTYSADFPVLNPYQSELLGTSDVFLTTFGPEGTPVHPGHDATLPGVSSWSLHPNPFYGTLDINIGTLEESLISILAFDLTGRQVGVIHEGMLSAGEHSLVWIPENLSPGVYFLRVLSGDVPLFSKRVVLLD